ncbi:hypothetical protein BDZ89DRAFT_1239242 [Hymenopellis radicata]|nr:hypothetical protein BDZ89DRAFT_1239242 [Hymenopellis radicata]
MSTPMSIKEIGAQVKLTQTFGNDVKTPIEAVYGFPVPARAAVSGFVMIKQDGTRVVGVVQEKAEAKATCDVAVAQGITASFMEQQTQDVENLPPNEQVEIELTYSTELAEDEDNDSIRFHLPVHIGARYGQSPSTLKSRNTAPISSGSRSDKVPFIELLRPSAELDVRRTPFPPNLDRILLFPTPKICHSPTTLGVFVITDGDAWDLDGVFQAVKDEVAAAPSKAYLRVYCLGIGNSASTAMCEGIARVGNGACMMVTEQESAITGKIARLLKAARTPLITDIKVDWGGLLLRRRGASSTSCYANQSRQDSKSFSGRLSVYLCHLEGEASSKDCLSSRSDRRWLKYRASDSCHPQPASHSGRRPPAIHALAARKIVQDFEDGRHDAMIKAGNEAKFTEDSGLLKRSIKAHIVRLGKTYSIVSSHTSFVAVDESGKYAGPRQPPRGQTVIRYKTGGFLKSKQAGMSDCYGDDDDGGSQPEGLPRGKKSVKKGKERRVSAADAKKSQDPSETLARLQAFDGAFLLKALQVVKVDEKAAKAALPSGLKDEVVATIFAMAFISKTMTCIKDADEKALWHRRIINEYDRADSNLFPPPFAVDFTAGWNYVPEWILRYVEYLPARQFVRFHEYLKVGKRLAKNLIHNHTANPDTKLKGRDILSLLAEANKVANLADQLSEDELLSQVTWRITPKSQDQVRQENAEKRSKITANKQSDFTATDPENITFTNAVIKIEVFPGQPVTVSTCAYNRGRGLLAGAASFIEVSNLFAWLDFIAESSRSQYAQQHRLDPRGAPDNCGTDLTAVQLQVFIREQVLHVELTKDDSGGVLDYPTRHVSENHDLQLQKEHQAWGIIACINFMRDSEAAAAAAARGLASGLRLVRCC